MLVWKALALVDEIQKPVTESLYYEQANGQVNSTKFHDIGLA
jgi:hypothetical protein